MINYHIHIGGINKNSSRILKETKYLVDAGLVDEIKVLTVNKGQKEKENLFEKVNVERINLPFSNFKKNLITELIRFLFFYCIIFYRNRFSKNDIINIHSIHLLPLGVLIKVIFKASLIYDAHELETEVAGSEGFRRFLSKKVERFSFNFIDKLIVVSPKIKEWYEKEYSINNITVIRNIPYLNKTEYIGNDYFKKFFSLDDDSIIFLYQGIINEKRGCLKLVEIFKKMPMQYNLIFMGFGPLKNDIICISKECKNIHFHSAVPSNEIVKFASSADFGIHFIEVGSILNHKYCLPNKMFEYIQSSLPLVVNSNAIEMKKIIDEFHIGVSIDSDNLSVDDIKSELLRLSKVNANEFKNNLLNAKLTLNWEKESKVYNTIYS